MLIFRAWATCGKIDQETVDGGFPSAMKSYSYIICQLISKLYNYIIQRREIVIFQHSKLASARKLIAAFLTTENLFWFEFCP